MTNARLNFILEEDTNENIPNCLHLGLLENKNQDSSFREYNLITQLRQKSYIKDSCWTIIFNKPNNFRCSAGVKKVCITPDDKVYGCTCICKPVYEVGEIIDGEIYIYSDFENDRTWCLGDKMGELGIENIQDLNNPKIKNLVRKI